MAQKRSMPFDVEIDSLTDLQLNYFVPPCLGIEVLGVSSAGNNTVVVNINGREREFNPVEVNHNLIPAIMVLAKLSVIQDESGVFVGQNLSTKVVNGLPILVGDNMVHDTSMIRGVYRCLLKLCSGGRSYVTAYIDYDRFLEVPILDRILDRSNYTFG